MRLHHFTCDHGAEGIRETGVIRPNDIPAVVMGRETGMAGAPPVVWLTDLEAPTQEQVGLTSRLLTCDRLVNRFTVDVDAVRWRHFAREHGCAPWWRRALERFGDPYHWFVSTAPVDTNSAAGRAAAPVPCLARPRVCTGAST